MFSLGLAVFAAACGDPAPIPEIEILSPMATEVVQGEIVVSGVSQGAVLVQVEIGSSGLVEATGTDTWSIALDTRLQTDGEVGIDVKATNEDFEKVTRARDDFCFCKKSATLSRGRGSCKVADSQQAIALARVSTFTLRATTTRIVSPLGAGTWNREADGSITNKSPYVGAYKSDGDSGNRQGHLQLKAFLVSD